MQKSQWTFDELCKSLKEERLPDGRKCVVSLDVQDHETYWISKVGATLTYAGNRPLLGATNDKHHHKLIVQTGSILICDYTNGYIWAIPCL